MNGSNLPPGVTESMIPGNRPEDEAEERFYDDLALKVSNEGMTWDRLDQLTDDEDVLKLVLAAREIGYERGVQEGRADEQLAEAARQLEAAEAASEPTP